MGFSNTAFIYGYKLNGITTAAAVAATATSLALAHATAATVTGTMNYSKN
jgi:hypothetical protein